MSGSVYLREWTAARRRTNSNTPDLFSARRFKLFGIRRTLAKLGASSVVDLEKLDDRELEKVRAEIATQLSSRKRGTDAGQTTTTKTN